MNLWKRIKKSFQEYLNRLGKENQNLFGDSKPDCCSLNRKSNEESKKR